MGTVLNTVFDSLDVRVFRHARPSQRLRLDADVWRQLIDQFEPGDAPSFVQLPGLGTFRVKMGGKAPYEFVLINPQVCDIRVWNPDRWDSRAAAQTGQLYVSFRSVFLQRFGLYGVRSALEGLTDLFCEPGPVHVEAGPEFDRVARVDLAVDTQEDREMVWGDLDRFVCRARKLDTWAHVTPANIEELLKIDLRAGGHFLQEHQAQQLAGLPQLARSSAQMIQRFMAQVVQDMETHGEAELSRVVSHNRKPQTVYFGRFGSKLYARRYNKLGSLIVQNKLYMQEVWLKAGWDGVSPVIRTEFSISGDFLKDYALTLDGCRIDDCRDLSLLEHVAPVLWDYLVCDWLTMRTPTADSNYRRWPLAQEWACMRGAFGASDMAGERDHGRTIPREDEHLVKQARGCSVSTVALRTLEKGGYNEALTSIIEELWHGLSDDEFKADVELRLNEYGLDTYTDTQLSAMFRQERMYEKTGS